MIANCPLPLYEPNPIDPDQARKVVFLAPDQRGIPLEVAALDFEDGLMVIHAMRLRRRYLAQYMEAHR